MNTVGRRLTHSKPESTASCSTSLLRSPRKRDGWREKSSSALMADSATRRVTPSRRARRYQRLEFVAECAGVEEYRRGAGQTLCRGAQDFDPGGKACGVWLSGDGTDLDAGCCELGDQWAADVAGCARDENCVHEAKDDVAPGKVTPGPCNFSRPPFRRNCMSDSPSVEVAWRNHRAVPGEPRLSDARRRRGGRGRRAGGVPSAVAHRRIADRRRPCLADGRRGPALPGPAAVGTRPPRTTRRVSRSRYHPVAGGRSRRPGHPRRRGPHRAAGGAAAAEPGERVAFVLHDVFQMPFEEIAETVGRPVGTCRQLARRARAKFSGASPRLADISDTEHQRRHRTVHHRMRQRRPASADRRLGSDRVGRRHDPRRLRPAAADQSRPRRGRARICCATWATAPRWSPDRSGNRCCSRSPNVGCSRCWC